MKKIVVNFTLMMFLFLVLLAFCSLVKEIKNKDLYTLTDKYVESLYTKYESYGLSGSAELTPDGKYQVYPIGRLVDVKIMSVVEHSVYENLKNDLAKHYKNDTRVKNVYINQGGTIIIDCRK